MIEYHDDYQPAALTPRHIAADRLAELLGELGVSCQVGRSADGRCWEVFATAIPATMPDLLWLRCRVFSTDYVRVSFEVSYPGFHPDPTFGSVETAALFIHMGFAAGKMDEANAIPTREPRRKPAAAADNA